MNPILKIFITEGLGVDESALPKAGQAKVPIPMAVRAGRILTDEMLARIGSRATSYDAESRFFEEDFKELRADGSGPATTDIGRRSVIRESTLLAADLGHGNG